jgi:hypothetical protein
MVVVSHGVEGVVCEEQLGHVNIYNVLYCILQGSRVSPPRFLTPRGLENSRALLCTPTSAYILVIAFPSSSLAILYSRCLEMSHCQSLGVGMPWVRVLQLPSKVPPRARITCAYLCWFVSVVELNRLPGKSGGEPCVCGTIRGPIDIQLIL